MIVKTFNLNLNLGLGAYRSRVGVGVTGQSTARHRLRSAQSSHVGLHTQAYNHQHEACK